MQIRIQRAVHGLARASTGLALVTGLLWAPAAQASVSFQVLFDDAAALYGGYHGAIERTVVSAGRSWVSNFSQPAADTVLTVKIAFANVSTANGGSLTSFSLGSSGGLNLLEQGAATELRTGIDPNGSTPDIQINIGINGYLQNELWFDPTPDNPADDVVPINRTDARSVMLHELGHAFGFNGWRNGSTGALPGDYLSTFDAQVALTSTAAGNLLVFTGAAAQAVYGGPVPITFGNYSHIGNNAPRAGADLIPDLMNGVVYQRGTRYSISALDLAMMLDAGLPVLAAVPEPGSLALWCAGLVGVVAWASLARPAQRRQA